ncbi:MAG: sigma-54-dependent Fis family transcriptional regulator [Nitrospirae bacterium]|nr:sigma-54-dependent Fis family transcriptional regulator [Nitrospirota bacterium]
MNKVLVIDDDDNIRETCSTILNRAGIDSISFPSAEKGLSYLSKNTVDAVIMDMKMPELNGLDATVTIRNLYPDLPVIIITGYGDIETAVKAMQLGAFDFIVKPIHPSVLVLSVKKAIKGFVLKREVHRLSEVVGVSIENTIGKSPAIIKIIKELQQISQSNISVLLQGETGTGKSYFAKIIHLMSNRRKNQFIKIDINSLAETVLESELFGHEMGSFSGAYAKRKGYFEIASGGTIFLDDIQNLSNIVQSKLLSVIDDRAITPVGSNTPKNIDVRIIAATNRDLQKDVSEKLFRNDLFYRIGEYIITIPPLRERKEDIEFFIWMVIYESNEELNRHIKEIPKETLDLLTNHSWPGNIRELRNVIRRAMINASNDTLNPELIDFLVYKNPIQADILNLKTAIVEAEIKIIIQALKAAGGNKSIACKLLQISYRSLLMKIKEYGITYL